MKKLFILPILLVLAACDKPKYNVVLTCDDGAGTENGYLVEAKIYKTKANLAITRLDKKLREKNWLINHAWLYNQIPMIDDKIEVSLPVVKEFATYEDPKHIKIDIGHNSLSGGLGITLWHAAANNLITNDGYMAFQDGEWVVGTHCEPVIYRETPDYGNISSVVKNCANYIDSQNYMDTVAPGTAAYLVYDEESKKEMFISKEDMNIITNGVPLSHYSLHNIKSYPDEIQHACEMADKLKAYIKEHISTSAITEKNFFKRYFGE